MEGKDVTSRRREYAGSVRRLSLRGAALAAVAGLIALEWRGARAGAGAVAGGLAAGFYAVSFLHSHLSRVQRVGGLEPKLAVEKALDPRLALQAGVRMGAVALLAAAAWLIGRNSLVAFLSAFAFGLAVLLALELPRAIREVRTVSTDRSAPMHRASDPPSGRKESA